MKKLYLFKPVFILLFILNSQLSTLNSLAQAPELFNYQAVVRDAAGEVLINQDVKIRVGILNSNTFIEIFAEEHSLRTNEFGLLNIMIGSGIPLAGTFGSIPWAANSHWLTVGIDPSGGENYTINAGGLLLSVPYALYAKTSGSSYWAKNGDNIYYNTGKVGIGTDTPNNDLTLGNSSADISFDDGESSFIYWREEGSDPKVQVGYDGNNFRIINWKPGGSLSFTSNDQVFFKIGASIYLTLLQNGDLDLKSEKLIFSTSNADIMFKRGAGSHLIWEESESTKAWLGYDGSNINIDNFETGGNINIDAKDAIYFQSDNSTKMTIKNNGYIGFGTTNPDSDLHLKQSGNSFTSGLRLERSNNSDWWSIQTNHNSDLVFDFNGTDTRAWLDDTSAGFHNISDRRLKQDISRIENVLNKIMQLEPVTYRFKSNPNTDYLSYGLIAQDVQKVFPEFVSENNGKLGLAYYNFGVISIRAIQEQQEIITNQQEQIAQLKEDNKLMKIRLDKLEALLQAEVTRQ